MKKLLFMLLASLVLIACEERNIPSSGGGTQNVKIDFTYQMTSPFTYTFTNTSYGANSYKWDFGDGTWSNSRDAMHMYESTGTYRITLTGTANNLKYDCSKNIVVKKPEIYIAGYVLYNIPYQNKYYKIVCKDDDLFGTDWGFQTVYTPLLDNTDLPYVKYFSNPLIMDKLDGDNYYTFYVYHTTNTSSSSGDTQCLKQKLYKTTILEYRNENILTSDNGQTQIGILMEYK